MLGLACSDFARHYSRNHGCFLFLRVMRCFTSPRSLHRPYFIQAGVTGHDSCRVSPFGNPRITARLAAPRGLSQPPTSFIGSWCQGIHRAPLLTWPQRCSRPLCSSQGTGGPIPGLVACPEAVLRAVRRGVVLGPGHHDAVICREDRRRGGRIRGLKRRVRPVPSGPNSVPKPLRTFAVPFLPASRLY